MLEELGMSAYKFIMNSGEDFWDIAHTIIYGVTEPAREAAHRWEPIRNTLILLPLPLILFGVLLGFFIRSYRKPEKVLKSTTVEQLEARGRSPKKYLRFWRVEMVMVMLFTLAFAAFVVTSMGLVQEFGRMEFDNTTMAVFSGIFMYVLIAYGAVMGAVAYFGRGYYFGRWGIRFIAITQGGPPNPRSGSNYTM